jgi:hypothetical protein
MTTEIRIFILQMANRKCNLAKYTLEAVRYETVIAMGRYLMKLELKL